MEGGTSAIRQFMRKCNACTIEKPISEFHRDSKSKDGIARTCRTCRLIQNKKWQSNNPERAKKCWKKSSKKRYNREEKRLKKYNLTKEIYQELKIFSNNQCNICEQNFVPYEYIDHCHTTGKIRGLLCGKCNTAIGSMRDNPILLRKAAEYVEKSGFWDFKPQ